MSRLDQRGMTLVELTITLVLTMVISTAVIVFMVSGLRTYSTASIKADLLAQAQTAADRISNDIMLSASADLNNRIDDANAPTPSNPNSWASDADTLILATAVEDQSRNIIYADPAMYISDKNNIIYYLNNGTLYRRVLASSAANNRAVTTCPPASATASCPGDSTILSDVTVFNVTYRNHLNQTVAPDEARSVEVSVTLQRKNETATQVSYKSRTVFRND
jgi:type II secretory pathway component PulJ